MLIKEHHIFQGQKWKQPHGDIMGLTCIRGLEQRWGFGGSCPAPCSPVFPKAPLGDAQHRNKRRITPRAEGAQRWGHTAGHGCTVSTGAQVQQAALGCAWVHHCESAACCLSQTQEQPCSSPGCLLPLPPIASPKGICKQTASRLPRLHGDAASQRQHRCSSPARSSWRWVIAVGAAAAIMQFGAVKASAGSRFQCQHERQRNYFR